MELDKTAITIAQRSAFELVDLSLVVMRRYWQPLLTNGLLGVLPFALVNFVLLWPLTRYESLVMASTDYATRDWYQIRYLYIMTAMVFLQAPLALSGVTYFIGRAVFIEEPPVSEVAAALKLRWFALVYVLGFWRLGLASWVFGAILYFDPLFQPIREILILGLFVIGGAYVLRGFRPFASEILLLEQCPLVTRGGNTAKLNYRQRSNWLHVNLSGELFGVHLGVTVAAILTTISFSMGFVFLVGVLVGNWQLGFWLDQLFFPIVLWGVAVWCTVIRFLLYLNSRIRLEGWEVELKLKAEAQRLSEAK